MTATFRVRPGRIADARVCARIEFAAERAFAATRHAAVMAPQPRPPEGYARAAATGRMLVAEASGTVIGFLISELEEASLHICELDVAPAHQRRGAARALVDALAAEARTLGLRALTLTTYSDVSWNAPLYARLGFEPMAAEAWTEACRLDSRCLAEGGRDISTRVAMRLRL